MVFICICNVSRSNQSAVNLLNANKDFHSRGTLIDRMRASIVTLGRAINFDMSQKSVESDTWTGYEH